ncbi:MAG TPA: ACT domain-containing protein [Spirochaetia bacterium]|nr:ACT domain-containing protein [Spirochaetales bacterium]HRY81112.1 ACT domain-containing protein [Spirochaetia bacterium]HRZ90672.1 ACT domain-containing protein [Spirochaetia bacterium]
MSVNQVSIFLENSKGRLAEVTRILAKEGIDLRALSLADTSDFGVLRIIVADPDRCLGVLKENGFVARTTEVVAVEVEDRPGGMSRVLDVLDEAGLNVEYMYAFVAKAREHAVVVCKIDERERAREVLKAKGIRTISAAELRGL